MSIINAIGKDILYFNKGKWVSYSFLVFTYLICICIVGLVLGIMTELVGFVDRVYYYINKNEYINQDIGFYFILSFVFILVAIILLSPISLAIKKIVTDNVLKGESVTLDLFVYYENFDYVKNICKNKLYKMFIVVHKFILYFIAPLLMFMFGLNMFIYADNSIYLFLGTILLGLSIILFVFFGIKYIYLLTTILLFDYLLISDLTILPKECYRKSKELGLFNKRDIVKMYISFIPAIASCILVIPMFVTIPYVWTFKAIFANYLIEKEKEKIK